MLPRYLLIFTLVLINKNIKGKNITLLCYEKDEEICHRKFVKNICEQELLKINN